MMGAAEQGACWIPRVAHLNDWGTRKKALDAARRASWESQRDCLRLLVCYPPLSPEHATQPGGQGWSNVLKSVDVEGGSPLWRGQICGLRVSERAVDSVCRDLKYLIPIYKSKTAIGSQNNPVEEVLLGDLQHVLDLADRLS